MPVDRELVLPSPSARVRDFVRRLGLAGFWAWWTKELSTFVPARPRAAVQRRRMRPVLAFDGERATLWLPSLKDARIAMVETASIGLSGDPAVVAAEGRAALTKRFGQAAGAPILGPKLIVSLAPRATLRKTLVLPAAVENDLRQALELAERRLHDLLPAPARVDRHAEHHVELVDELRYHVRRRRDVDRERRPATGVADGPTSR